MIWCNYSTRILLFYLSLVGGNHFKSLFRNYVMATETQTYESQYTTFIRREIMHLLEVQKLHFKVWQDGKQLDNQPTKSLAYVQEIGASQPNCWIPEANSFTFRIRGLAIAFWVWANLAPRAFCHIWKETKGSPSQSQCQKVMETRLHMNETFASSLEFALP